MSPEVMAVVLVSALLHAGWNALVRAQRDKYLGSLQVVLGAGALALALLPWLPPPAAPSWPYLLASGLIHVLYFTLVARAYQSAELTVAYPLMRGTAPALTTLAGTLMVGETPSLAGGLGIALICLGVLSLAWPGGAQRPRHPPAALLAALGNAALIALYTVVDGLGVRLAGHALSYTAWVFLLTALLMLASALALRGRSLRHGLAGAAGTAALGGAATLTAYSLVLWAMARAPLASVAALRETSIAFAVLLGWWWLRERPSRRRLGAIALVGAGAIGIRLG